MPCTTKGLQLVLFSSTVPSFSLVQVILPIQLDITLTNARDLHLCRGFVSETSSTLMCFNRAVQACISIFFKWLSISEGIT